MVISRADEINKAEVGCVVEEVEDEQEAPVTTTPMWLTTKRA